MTTTKYRSQQTAYAVKYNLYYRMGYRRTVPSLGPMRRIQALHAIGFTRRQLTEETGLKYDYLYRLARGMLPSRISAEYAKIIADAYRTLCVQPQHNTTQCNRARTWAKKAGYAPPMAWDDIDDPTERPSRYAHGRDRTKETARRRELRAA